MIRRPPSPWPRRLRRALGPLVASAAIVLVLIMASQAPQVRRTPVARGRPTSPPAIAKVFHAVGGPVTATITVTGAPSCRVDLVGADGAVLAGGEVTAGALTLRALAVAHAPISLVLHPSRLAGLSWQADLTGAQG